MAFSIVATGFYLAHVGFNKDDMFVLQMERVEQIRFVCMFNACFIGLLYYLLNFYLV
jgi:hypothetical protein